MEPGFEIIPHTADMRMRVWGRNLEDIFRHALRGIASYLDPAVFALTKGGLKVREKIKIETVDLNALLIEFLSFIIAQSDMHNAVFTTVKFKELGENFLAGELRGIKVDGPEKDIKAVSYHEIDIHKNPETGMYETILVFEI